MTTNDSDQYIRSSEINPKNEEDYNCAPSKEFNNGSCITLSGLIGMAISYNHMYDDKIKLSSKLHTLNPDRYKRFLIKQFNNSKQLSRICNNQRCWLKQPFIKNIDNRIAEDLMENTHRPPSPQGRFTWLNTVNINKVMRQYEYLHKDFNFIGALPIDFNDLPQLGVTDIDFSNFFNKKIYKIGAIFNLDEHYKDGSHWVSLYTDMSRNKIYFSDSYGTVPDKRIRAFMRKIARFCKKCNKISEYDLDVRHNEMRHQYGNSECGMYSINFIARLLKGETFDKLTSDRLTDSEVNKCRDVYFA
jgi:hypothetical protein